MTKNTPISLVTGGAGFIGSHVVDQLLQAGHKVVVLDDLSGGRLENVNNAAEFVEGSVLDTDLVRDVFGRHAVDYVFHLAASPAEGLSHFTRMFNYTNNLTGSINVINGALNAGGVKCFVFTSSIAVYGENQLPMTEDLIPLPQCPYGIAKYAVELDLRAAHDVFGLDYLIFRPHNVYGERQDIGDKYRNVIGIFIGQALAGRPMTIFGDGLQTRAFSYIGDVAPAMVRAAMTRSCYNDVFNVGADKPYSISDLAHTVAEVLGVEPSVMHMPPRVEVAHAYAAHGKLSSILGEHAVTGLREGIRRMAEWVKTAAPQERPSRSRIEVERNLPPSWRPNGNG